MIIILPFSQYSHWERAFLAVRSLGKGISDFALQAVIHLEGEAIGLDATLSYEYVYW